MPSGANILNWESPLEEFLKMLKQQTVLDSKSNVSPKISHSLNIAHFWIESLQKFHIAYFLE